MEVNCLPVENQEHQRYIERSVKEVENTKRKLAVFDTPNDIPGGTYLLPGNLASAVVSNFTVRHLLAPSSAYTKSARHRTYQAKPSDRKTSLCGCLRTSFSILSTTVSQDIDITL